MMLEEKIGRKAASGIGSWAKEYVPAETQSEQELKVRAKERLIVLTKIALRPGDNTDMLEALGLIPAVVTE